MRKVIIGFLLICAGCISESPIAQNGLRFTREKFLPGVTGDSLHPVYPNPFNRATGDTTLLIDFTLHDSSSAIVLVQNALGDPITQFDSTLPPGTYHASWGPLAVDGTRLNAGIYFVTLHTPTYVNSRLVNIQVNE